MARAAAAARVAGPAPSAPARRSAPARPAPARRRSPAPRPTIVQKGREAARARVSAAIDGLLHGPGLIALVFVLLVGIVFSNVALLQKNRQITHDAARVSELKRDNATLRKDVAELGSSERIQQVAAERGLVLPAPDEVRYLRSNPRADALAAAKRLDEGSALASTPTYTPPAPTYAPPATPTPIAAAPAYEQTTPASTTGTAIAGTPEAVADATAGLP
jgi:cell division protein FtsL